MPYCPRSSLPAEVLAWLAARLAHLLPSRPPGTGGTPPLALEVRLARAGVPAEAALGGGSWIARRWLGLPGLEEGAPADVVAYPADPRQDLEVLAKPTRVILRGRILR